MAKFKKKTEYTVVLQCKHCKEFNEWELSQFMRALGKRYLKHGEVSQYCGCRETGGLGNTPHTIVGVVQINHKPMTPRRVFNLHERLKKK